MGMQTRHLLGLVFIFAAACVAVSAQGVGSSRGLPSAAEGSHIIQGHVFMPSGRAADQGVIVKLEAGVTGVRSTATDGSGTFIFNGLPAGDYAITVDAGPDYDLIKESVVIYGTSAGGNMQAGTSSLLDLHLVPKGSAATAEKQFAGVPKPALDNYKKGLSAAGSGDTKKAVDLFKQAASTAPTFAPAFNQLGVQYLKLAQPDKAAEALDTAVKLDPEGFDPHLNFGIALLNLQKFPEAEEQLRIALTKNTSAPTGHMYLGMALLRQRKYPEAQAELEAAVSSHNPETAMAHRYLAGLYSQNQEYKRAADEVDTFLSLNPKAADAEKLRSLAKDWRSKQP